VNGGVDITLPSSVDHSASLQFRWTVTIVNNPNGSYRMDDFNLKGTLSTGFNSPILNSSCTIFPNPSLNEIEISNTHLATSQTNLEIVDMLGKCHLKQQNIHLPLKCNIAAMPSGVYFLILKNEQGAVLSKNRFSKM
jgi:hypothetical protein